MNPLLRLAVVCIVFFAPRTFARTVSGEIFIRLESGDTLPCSAIEVHAVPASELPAWQQRYTDSLQPYVEKSRKAQLAIEAARAQEAQIDARKPADYSRAWVQEQEAASRATMQALVDATEVSSAAMMFASNPLPTMPPTLASAVTNSRGEFALEVASSDRVLIVALFTCTVRGERATTLWCLPVAAGAKDTVVSLNNANVVSGLDSAKP